MVKHLGLDHDGVFDAKTELYDESRTTVETREQMRALDESKPYPMNALEPGSKVAF